MKDTIVRLGYKFRYYWKKVCNFCGFCNRCYGKVNYTRGGKAICPYCSR